jgi:hypothetical protein
MQRTQKKKIWYRRKFDKQWSRSKVVGITDLLACDDSDEQTSVFGKDGGECTPLFSEEEDVFEDIEGILKSPQPDSIGNIWGTYTIHRKDFCADSVHDVMDCVKTRFDAVSSAKIDHRIDPLLMAIESESTLEDVEEIFIRGANQNGMTVGNYETYRKRLKDMRKKLKDRNSARQLGQKAKRMKK